VDSIKFRYFRDNQNRPIITECAIETPIGVGLGLAICSPMDMPCKKVGRNIARQRASFALASKKNTCDIRRKHVASIVWKCYGPPNKFPESKSMFVTEDL